MSKVRDYIVETLHNRFGYDDCYIRTPSIEELLMMKELIQREINEYFHEENRNN